MKSAIRALCPPDRADLERTEWDRQLRVIVRKEAGQRHREIESQRQVGQVGQYRARREVLGQPAL
jgi:hypothetical protein